MNTLDKVGEAAGENAKKVQRYIWLSRLSDELLDMTDKSGEISLLDTNKDGKYDIVFVADYYNMVVDTVSSSGKINDKYGAKTITLDEDVTFSITRGLENLEVSDLKEYDILSVAESLDHELFEIIVSNIFLNSFLYLYFLDNIYYIHCHILNNEYCIFLNQKEF